MFDIDTLIKQARDHIKQMENSSVHNEVDRAEAAMAFFDDWEDRVAALASLLEEIQDEARPYL